jgi:hypothetical protein
VRSSRKLKSTTERKEARVMNPGLFLFCGKVFG